MGKLLRVTAVLVAGCATNTSALPDDTAVESIEVRPATLRPAFSPSIEDYYVVCGEGPNYLEVTVGYADGRQISTSQVVEINDVVTVGDVWIRCLPFDFPAITVVTHPELGAPTPGYYLVDSLPYAAVLDTNGTPIWYQATTDASDVDSLDANQISYMGNAEFPYAYDATPQFTLLSLATGATTTLGSPDAPTNEHELQQLPNGNLLLFADQLTPNLDLSGLGSGFGSSETIDDCKIEELDATGEVVWSWLASTHVDPVLESVYPLTNVIDDANVADVFHCNSIDIGSAGDLLISMRHTSAVYDIDMTTGIVQWKLGGTAYSKDGAPILSVVGDAEGGFNLQHDARFAADGDITLYDDHGEDNNASGQVARGMELALDHTAGTAQIVWQAPGPQESNYMGSFRRQPDGHSVVGWGFLPSSPLILSEFDGSANDVLDIAFTLPDEVIAVSYRAVKVPLTQLDHDLLRAAAAQGAL